jgi:hypothetical protein
LAKHHLIVTGTGRAGTTFLVQLFTRLGLDTGFANPHADLFPHCDAGMEFDFTRPDAPYILKSPFLCDVLDYLLSSGQIVVDHAIVPMRDLFAAAESRRDVVRRTAPDTREPDMIQGGLWHTRRPAEQEGALTDQLYTLMVTLAKHRTPTTLLFFPRLVQDPEYLYERLGALLGPIDYQLFHDAFREIARPELVHDFQRTHRSGGESA